MRLAVRAFGLAFIATVGVVACGGATSAAATIEVAKGTTLI